ncbi:hypothetical protein K449DRAFT_174203 [Hypoxylon sp. EC38]|nr:hypothetical protein K449DRAFT_174203 [Hypoxylon sp. EC38]
MMKCGNNARKRGRTGGKKFCLFLLGWIFGAGIGRTGDLARFLVWGSLNSSSHIPAYLGCLGGLHPFLPAARKLFIHNTTQHNTTQRNSHLTPSQIIHSPSWSPSPFYSIFFP